MRRTTNCDEPTANRDERAAHRDERAAHGNERAAHGNGDAHANSNADRDGDDNEESVRYPIDLLGSGNLEGLAFSHFCQIPPLLVKC
jgi:hypothetical protein